MVSFLMATLRSAIDFFPQASNLVSGTSVRAGIEPLARLKASWKLGFMTALASVRCPLACFWPTLNMANWSVLKMKLPSVPGYWKQRKSTLGFLPALMNSPLAQSPIICIAAVEVVVHQGPELGHLIEGLLHGLAAHRGRVELDHRLLVEGRPAGRHHGAVEDGGFLPGLAAVRERDVSSGLDLRGDGEELVEGLGRGDLQLVEDLLVRPDPVGPVDVHRRGHPLALGVLRALGQRGRHHLVPVLFV